MLAGFHIDFNKALHPWWVASWMMVSKQYLLPESILSWFWSGLLTISLTCSCSWLMCSRLCMSPIRDALEWSTDASLLGMGDAALASSSWLFASEGPELSFDWAKDSLFGVLLLLLWLFLLGILAFKLMMSKQWQYSSWIQLNTCLHKCNGLQKKNNQKVGNSIPNNRSPSLGHLVPLPTMEDSLQSAPSSFLMRFWLTINNRFPRFQWASQEASTPLQHSDELRQVN